MSGPVVFGAGEIAAAVTMDMAIDSARRALIAAAAGEVSGPPPWHLQVPGAPGEVHVKGAVLDGAQRFAIKAATGFPGNAARGLPTSSGFSAVFDAQTGEIAGLLLDGGYLTELRTGAAGAVALDALSPAELDRVTVIGTGGQARFQLTGLLRVRTPGEIVVAGRRIEAATQLAGWLREQTGVRVIASDDLPSAVRGAAAVVTVTSATQPVVREPWLSPGVHITAVGSDSPGKRELDPRIVTSAALVAADDLDQSRHLGELEGISDEDRAGRLASLGSILAGAEPGRRSPGETTVADLSGIGAQDAAIAETAWSALT